MFVFFTESTAYFVCTPSKCARGEGAPPPRPRPPLGVSRIFRTSWSKSTDRKRPASAATSGILRCTVLYPDRCHFFNDINTRIERNRRFTQIEHNLCRPVAGPQVCMAVRHRRRGSACEGYGCMHVFERRCSWRLRSRPLSAYSWRREMLCSWRGTRIPRCFLFSVAPIGAIECLPVFSFNCCSIFVQVLHAL